MPRCIECKAVLFDVDGVLVDSTRSVERTVHAWAKRHRLDPMRVMQVAHGRRAVDTVRLCAPHLDAELEAEELQRMEVEDARGVRAVDGAADLLAAIPPGAWAVVTSSARAVATARLHNVRLPVPRLLVSAEDVANGKPHPECYLKGAELLGVSPNACAVVEDAPSGVLAAREAGMSVVAVATTHSEAELRGADVVARCLGDVRIDDDHRSGRGHPRLALLVG